MAIFTSHPRDSVGFLGETELIARIQKWLGVVGAVSPYGIGDDCAVLPPARRRQLITVDPVILGRHFDENANPRKIGAKLLKRNLSDIAAMGGTPEFAVISLSLAAAIRTGWLREFYRGLAAEAKRYRVKIVGGDVTQLDQGFVASLTLLGHASGKRILTRRGSRIGDRIFVTGKLGGSLLGRHLSFMPRLAEGAWLAGRREVRALMDVSDGLAKDLGALTPPSARASLNANLVPISPAARQLSKTTGRSALEHALCDGEDYELVFSMDKKADVKRFEAAWRRRFPTPIAEIGSFVALSAPSNEEVPLALFRGYEHLR